MLSKLIAVLQPTGIVLYCMKQSIYHRHWGACLDMKDEAWVPPL